MNVGRGRMPRSRLIHTSASVNSTSDNTSTSEVNNPLDQPLLLQTPRRSPEIDCSLSFDQCIIFSEIKNEYLYYLELLFTVVIPVPPPREAWRRRRETARRL